LLPGSTQHHDAGEFSPGIQSVHEPIATPKKWFWKGCKPNFVCALASGENHLSQQPVPGTRSLSRNSERAAPRSPIWPCTRWGLPCLVACASSGGLLHHLFTLTTVAAVYDRRISGAHRAPLQWRYILCGTFRRDASQRHLPRVSPTKSELRGIAPGGVRTFLPHRAEAQQKRFSAFPKPEECYLIGSTKTRALRGERIVSRVAYYAVRELRISPPRNR